MKYFLESKKNKQKKKAQSYATKKAQADAQARTKRGGTTNSLLNQTDAELKSQGYTHLDVIDNLEHRRTAEDTRSAYQKESGCVGHMCRAVIRAHATDSEKDLSQSDANRRSAQLHRGIEQTRGATIQYLRQKKPDQPRGMNEFRKPPEGPDKNKPVFKLPQYKKQAENVGKGKCATCGGEAGEFTDALSEKEYKISGMCQNCQDKTFGEAVEKEEMFPKLSDIPNLTRGLSPAQIIIWKKAMNKRSSATGRWRSPKTAKRLALRLADSVIYERASRRRTDSSSQAANLIKQPRFAERNPRTITPIVRQGGLTGSNTYRPASTHATLVKNQPWRMAEKLRGLLSMWRKKSGGIRQVVKNIPITPNFGTERIKKIRAYRNKK